MLPIITAAPVVPVTPSAQPVDEDATGNERVVAPASSVAIAAGGPVLQSVSIPVSDMHVDSEGATERLNEIFTYREMCDTVQAIRTPDLRSTHSVRSARQKIMGFCARVVDFFANIPVLFDALPLVLLIDAGLLTSETSATNVAIVSLFCVAAAHMGGYILGPLNEFVSQVSQLEQQRGLYQKRLRKLEQILILMGDKSLVVDLMRHQFLTMGEVFLSNTKKLGAEHRMLLKYRSLSKATVRLYAVISVFYLISLTAIVHITAEDLNSTLTTLIFGGSAAVALLIFQPYVKKLADHTRQNIAAHLVQANTALAMMEELIGTLSAMLNDSDLPEYNADDVAREEYACKVSRSLLAQIQVVAGRYLSEIQLAVEFNNNGSEEKIIADQNPEASQLAVLIHASKNVSPTLYNNMYHFAYLHSFLMGEHVDVSLLPSSEWQAKEDAMQRSAIGLGPLAVDESQLQETPSLLPRMYRFVRGLCPSRRARRTQRGGFTRTQFPSIIGAKAPTAAHILGGVGRGLGGQDHLPVVPDRPPMPGSGSDQRHQAGNGGAQLGADNNFHD